MLVIYSEKSKLSLIWCCMPIIPALGRSRQEDQDFQASSLGYMTRFYLTKPNQTAITQKITRSVFVGVCVCKLETYWERESYQLRNHCDFLYSKPKSCDIKLHLLDFPAGPERRETSVLCSALCIFDTDINHP